MSSSDAGHAGRLLGALTSRPSGPVATSTPAHPPILGLWSRVGEVGTREEAHRWILDQATRVLPRHAAAIFEFIDLAHLGVTAHRGPCPFLQGRLDCAGSMHGRVGAVACDGVGDLGGLQPVEEDLLCEAGLEACVPLRNGLVIMGALAIYADPGDLPLTQTQQALLLAIGRTGGLLLSQETRADLRDR